VSAAAVGIDAAAPLLTPRSLGTLVPAYRASGITCVFTTVASIEDAPFALGAIGEWLAVARRPAPAARVVSAAAAIRAAAAAGELAVGLHFQGCHPLGADANLVDVFAALGVRVMQLTYNYRNLVADGCFEPVDAGLSTFGRRLVPRMREAGVVVDVSHCSERTCLEAVDLAGNPVIASHSNARSVCDHPRNLSDEVIRAIAGSGGVIGICAFPAFVAPRARPTVDDFLHHATFIAQLVGAAHVGLGFDFADEDEEDFEYYGYDPRYYPRPPWRYPNGIESPERIGELREALARRGFAPAEVAGIMGENFMRVLERVWPA
jgi:membrane dipeptidase